MKLLDSRSTKEIDAHGWSERNVVVLYRQLIGAVKRRCSPECVKFFAMPEVGTDDQLDFYADDFTNASRYKDLKADAREALDRKLVPIVAEIEAFRKELSESARPNDRNLATVLDSVFSVPGHDSIWPEQKRKQAQ